MCFHRWEWSPSAWNTLTTFDRTRARHPGTIRGAGTRSPANTCPDHHVNPRDLLVCRPINRGVLTTLHAQENRVAGLLRSL